MTCMKCGKEVPEKQVFCDSCLQDMEQYPVKPGTVIHLPNRETEEVAKKGHKKKKEMTSKELIVHLQKQVKYHRYLTVILLTLLVIAGIFLFRPDASPEELPVTGRNYTIDSTHTP